MTSLDCKCQAKSESVGRFPILLRHGIRGGALEAQGEELKILLSLMEEIGGIGRIFWMATDVLCVYFSKLFVLACGYTSHGSVV